MMTSLFSVFDPVAFMNLSLNWGAGIFGLFLLTSNFWIGKGRIPSIFTSIKKVLFNEYNTLSGMKWMGGLMMMSIFFMILSSNSFGLFPYIFTPSSHMVFTFSLAFPLWLGYMIYGFITNWQSIVAHLVPLGTPTLLMPLMVLIESISSVIRPFTLAIRLASNMIAGHLLLSLMSGAAVGLSVKTLSILLISQILLLILESAVAVIQAYVFVTLTTLYSSEVTQ